MTGWSLGVTAILVMLALLLIWFSLVMSETERAVSRVTRAGLNNLILEVQTDTDSSRFVRMKKIARIQKAKQLIADRFSTSGSCVFFRITSNVFDGVVIASLCFFWNSPLWLGLLLGFLFSVFISVTSVLVRGRSNTRTKPVDVMIRHTHLVALIVKFTPFASISTKHVDKRKHHQSELSDDEELEKMQLEQGRATIDRLVESGDFDPEVSEMLRNVLTLSETLTREIMVPRTDMICIDSKASLADLLKLCSRSGFSRIPVIGSDMDDLIGIAYLKDAVKSTAFNPAAGSRSVQTICRQPTLVPESKAVDDLFHQMQTTRQHVAMVVDEYGGIAGLVTIEDTLEQIVGELEDEHDHTQHAEPELIDRNKWKMPARTSINDLEEIFEIDLDEDDVDTVYGLLIKLLGRVPIVGMSGVTRGLRLTAVDSAGRRKKVSTIVVEPARQVQNESTDNVSVEPSSSEERQKADHDHKPEQEEH